ncbi:MAG: hypothetical protein ACOX9E_02210 [Lentisphaeria bacterium]|jgi:hypothetical protein
MATKNRRDIEITLVGMQMPSLAASKSSGHLLTVNLVWPRVNIALRTAVKTIDLAKGECNANQWPWCRRVFFKETVEDRFAITVTVSEALSAHRLAQFARFFAGAALDIGEDIVEDALPGAAGDLAAVPLDYASKKLLKPSPPAIWATGDCDLDSPSLAPDSATITVPLIAARKRVKNVVKHQHSKSAPPAHRKQIVIVDKDAPDGFVQLAIRSLT